MIQVLDQSIAERQGTETSMAVNQPTVTGMAPSWGRPVVQGGQPQPGQPQPGQPPPGQPQHGQPQHGQPRLSQTPPPGPAQTRQMRRRPKTWVIAAAAAAVVAAVVVAVIVIPGGSHPVSPSAASSSSAAANAGKSSAPKLSNSASPSASAKVLVADDFSTSKAGWVDDAHASAGAYTGSGAYRLSVTGYNGQNELARPSSAGSGLSGVTPMDLDASVDVRTLSGAAQGYGLGLAFRGDGNGDLYAFLIEDHAVAIQKWVGNGAKITGEPAPVSVSDLQVGSSGRLRAVATTIDSGQAVHLELWLNGKKLVDYTDRDNPYTRGYLGLYVESISDSPSTAAAEFDNFTASQV